MRHSKNYKLVIPNFSPKMRMAIAASIGAFALAGCSGESDTQGRENTASSPVQSSAGHTDGGQPDGAQPQDAQEKVALLTDLGLMRGHLSIFYSLYFSDHIEHARTHAKHPESELYARIAPQLAARELDGFADKLSMVGEALDGAEKEVVGKAYKGANGAIFETEQALNANLSEQLQSIAQLVRTAGDEYKLAVAPDGTITNLHEYQDAMGFVLIAQERLSIIESDDLAAISKVQEAVYPALKSLESLFSGLIPTSVTPDHAKLHAVATHIDEVALALK